MTRNLTTAAPSAGLDGDTGAPPHQLRRFRGWDRPGRECTCQPRRPRRPSPPVDALHGKRRAAGGRRRAGDRPEIPPPSDTFSSRLARRLREERADQRAKISSATLRACGLAPLMLADRERESHLALALVAIVLVVGHGLTSPRTGTGGRGTLSTNADTRRIHCPRRWASRTWPERLALAEDERVHRP
jgi:hypothetical protein